MQIEDLNCTQFGESFPPPNSNGTVSGTVPWLIVTIVKAYRPIHNYLYTSIIIFSVFSNFAVLLVLRKKEMRGVGVNVTMILIAFCDFFCSVSAVAQLFLRQSTDSYAAYFNAYAQIAVDYLTVSFHGSSLYLAVGMAFCRVMTLSVSDGKSERWQTPRYALRVSFVLAAPVFLIASSILPLHTVLESEKNGIYIEIRDFAFENHCLYMKFCLIITGVCFKAVPCVVMLGLSLTLLNKVKKGMQMNAMVSQGDRNEQLKRSTRFIQSVVVVFIVTEAPQSLIGIAGGFFINDYLNYYQKLVIFSNVLAFLNTTTSFLVYSFLSSKFRKLFLQIFLPESVIAKIYVKSSVIQVSTRPTASASRTL